MKYLAKIIANDQEGLQMISACSSAAKVKISDIKYLHLIKYFYCQLRELKLKMKMKIKRLIAFEI